MDIFVSFVGCFVATLGLAGFIVTTKNWHGRFSMDSSEGVQKFHKAPTPRIGGVAIFTGLMFGSIWLEGEAGFLAVAIGGAGLIAFAAGLVEDLTKNVSVAKRLLATIASGLIFCLLTGYAVSDVQIPGLGYLLDFAPVAILFTAFAIGGIANAVNIIDGFNGLAAGAVVLMSLALAVVAWQVGDGALATCALLLAVAMVGFLVVNFPFGHLFLGDGGAYFVGFALAALAVMLPERNPEVSPWISLLILSYPLVETAYSIVRRFLSKEHAPGQPDSLHLHHLVYRSLSKSLDGRTKDQRLGNAAAGATMWGLPAIVLVFVAVVPPSVEYALIGFALVTVLYLQVYRKLSLQREGSLQAGSATTHRVITQPKLADRSAN